MAQYTIDVIGVQSAYVDMASPEVNYSSGNSLTARGYQNGSRFVDAYVGFNPPVAALGRRILDGTTIRLHITAKTASAGYENIGLLKSSILQNEWEEQEITWNNFKPATAYGPGKAYGDLPSSGECVIALTPSQAKTMLDDEGGKGLKIEAREGDPRNDCRITFNSTRAASGKPLVRLLMEDVFPQVSPITPSGAYAYPYAAYQIRWNTTDADNAVVFGGIRTTGSKFRYREVGAGSYTEITLANNARTYTLPANTLAAQKNYEWQVIETTTDGVSSSDATWYTITTHDSAPLKPTNLTPVGDYIAVDESNIFAWQHNIDTGTAQTKADLQYSLDNGAWQEIGTVTGGAQTAIIPADTLPSGRLRWQVRTYNTDDVPGEWSDPAAIVGVGAPPAPAITSITPANRPAVSWQSLGQVGYQVQIGEYDTGEVGGQAKTHKIPYYLPNGTYTARVRIKGASLLWSAWAEQEFTIDVTGPAKPALTAEATAGAAVLTFAATGAEKLYLLRDGIPIANVTGLTTYTDYAALGSAVYVLRAVDASDNYTDSDPVAVTVSVPCVIMAAVDALDEPVQMHMKKSDQHGASRQKDIIGTAHYYAGRTRPVYRFSGFVGEQYSPAFYYTTSTDFARLEALIDKRLTILYRDNLGNKYYGVITGITHTQENYMYEFALAIMRVDYIEQIDYEV